LTFKFNLQRFSRVLPLFLLAGVLGFPAVLLAQTCNPVSAQFITSGDDNTYAWVNGVSIGSFPYCGTGSGCVATPVPVPTTVFNEGQSVVLAVETDNINPNLVFSAWALEVNCNGGFEEVISSQSYPFINLYYDPNGAGVGDAACTQGGAVPPPLDGMGNTWNSFVYNPASNPFAETGAPITESPYYAAPISVSGNLIQPISYNASAYTPGSCGILYWRQVLTFPTPTPTSTYTFTSTPTLTPTLTPTYTPSFTPTMTYTPTVTPTPTDTFTPTNTPTHTDTFTPSSTPTKTFTPTSTYTPTNTPTPTATFTPCGYPGLTCTPTPTPPNYDVFNVDRNILNPGQGAVTILVEYSEYPGPFGLWIYNSAGEHIRTLDSKTLNMPVSQTYTWDGTNKYGDKCADGVYLIYLEEPFSKKEARILLIR
jgi:hypothetical protein